MESEIDRSREEAITEVEQGDVTEVVVVEAFYDPARSVDLPPSSMTVEDDQRIDPDFDSISARPSHEFHVDDCPTARVSFPRCSDRQVVARLLKKIVAVLEGTQGTPFTNVGALDCTDYAVRLTDGSVKIGNGRQEFKQRRLSYN